MKQLKRSVARLRHLAWYGWVGLSLVVVFWILNWGLDGLRTYWGFFPLWLGFCLLVDALVLRRKGTSLLTRNPRRYFGLFLFSALAWWLFELINARLGNWVYEGAESFSIVAFSLWATLSFTTVVPAVFGTAELVSTFPFIQKFGNGPAIRLTHATTLGFFITGLLMLVFMLIWPEVFFPFAWISVYFILEPVNVWIGRRTLAQYTAVGDWRPVFSIWIGVLVTGFFWEMWNFFSFPKWIYIIPYADWFHLFEMPMLGYGGYLPFGLELFALYNLITGFFIKKEDDYVLPISTPAPAHANLVYASIKRKKLLLDLYLPAGGQNPPFPLVVWVHGGAFRAGDKNDPTALPLVEAGFAVASINYRLSQEALFPAQLYDCKAAVRWLRAHASEYHLLAEKIGVWGASAGGHLAAMLGVTNNIEELEGKVGDCLEQSSAVQAVCDWFGPTNFLRMNDFPGSMDHDAADSPESELVGGPIQENPHLVAAANPITYVSKSAPPFLIMHGEDDPLVPANQSEILAAALRDNGIEIDLIMIPGMGHGFQGEEYIQPVVTFFEKHLVSG